MVYKISQNVQGRFYVNSNCINCSLCPEIAPDNFMTNNDHGFEYVCKQPENKIEKALVAEAINLCPSNAIKDSGKWRE